MKIKLNILQLHYSYYYLEILPKILNAHAAFTLTGQLTDMTELKSRKSSNDNRSSSIDENTRKIRS